MLYNNAMNMLITNVNKGVFQKYMKTRTKKQKKDSEHLHLAN